MEHQRTTPDPAREAVQSWLPSSAASPPIQATGKTVPQCGRKRFAASTRCSPDEATSSTSSTFPLTGDLSCKGGRLRFCLGWDEPGRDWRAKAWTTGMLSCLPNARAISTDRHFAPFEWPHEIGTTTLNVVIPSRLLISPANSSAIRLGNSAPRVIFECFQGCNLKFTDGLTPGPDRQVVDAVSRADRAALDKGAEQKVCRRLQ